MHATLLGAPAHVCAADLDRQLAAGVEAVHGALRAAAGVRRRLRAPIRLTVLGRGLVDVTGGESVNPASAAVLGLLSSAELEVPGLRCQLVDVGDRPAESALVEALAGEDRLVAVRGNTRWTPRLAASPAAPVAPPVRERGTYLITGGLGGIGLVLARALAESEAGPPGAGRADRGRGANGPGRGAATVGVAGGAGAKVSLRLRLTDAAALAGVVDAVQAARLGLCQRCRARRRVGRWRPSGTPYHHRAARVLAPKAAGVIAIDEVFADRARWTSSCSARAWRRPRACTAAPLRRGAFPRRVQRRPLVRGPPYPLRTVARGPGSHARPSPEGRALPTVRTIPRPERPTRTEPTPTGRGAGGDRRPRLRLAGRRARLRRRPGHARNGTVAAAVPGRAGPVRDVAGGAEGRGRHRAVGRPDGPRRVRVRVLPLAAADASS